MVRTMNLAVTICAVLANNKSSSTRIGVIKIQESTGMGSAFGTSQRMALLTKLWSLFGQQGRVIGAMRPMA